MSEHEQAPEEVDEQELDDQDGEELPKREVMSVITPAQPDGELFFPVEGDPGDRW